MRNICKSLSTDVFNLSLFSNWEQLSTVALELKNKLKVSEFTRRSRNTLQLCGYELNYLSLVSHRFTSVFFKQGYSGELGYEKLLG